jgi:hypothetical protein
MAKLSTKTFKKQAIFFGLNGINNLIVPSKLLISHPAAYVSSELFIHLPHGNILILAFILFNRAKMNFGGFYLGMTNQRMKNGKSIMKMKCGEFAIIGEVWIGEISSFCCSVCAKQIHL